MVSQSVAGKSCFDVLRVLDLRSLSNFVLLHPPCLLQGPEMLSCFLEFASLIFEVLHITGHTYQQMPA